MSEAPARAHAWATYSGPVTLTDRGAVGVGLGGVDLGVAGAVDDDVVGGDETLGGSWGR